MATKKHKKRKYTRHVGHKRKYTRHKHTAESGQGKFTIALEGVHSWLIPQTPPPPAPKADPLPAGKVLRKRGRQTDPVKTAKEQKKSFTKIVKTIRKAERRILKAYKTAAKAASGSAIGKRRGRPAKVGKVSAMATGGAQELQLKPKQLKTLAKQIAKLIPMNIPPDVREACLSPVAVNLLDKPGKRGRPPKDPAAKGMNKLKDVIKGAAPDKRIMCTDEEFKDLTADERIGEIANSAQEAYQSSDTDRNDHLVKALYGIVGYCDKYEIDIVETITKLKVEGSI